MDEPNRAAKYMKKKTGRAESTRDKSLNIVGDFNIHVLKRSIRDKISRYINDSIVLSIKLI